MLLLLALLIWPILSVVGAGFRSPEGDFTLFFFKRVFTSEYSRECLWNSFVLAVFSTGFCAVISIPLAWVMTYFDFYGKKILASLVLVPLILPPFVGALGLKRLMAANDGPVVLILKYLNIMPEDAMPDLLGGGSKFWASALLIALHLYPIMFLNVQAALANIDPTLEEAALNMGSGKWTIFRRVTLPLMMPGLFAGATIIFIWSFTELGTPLMVGYRDVTAVQVFEGLQQINVNPLPYAQVAVMLIASVIAYIIGKMLLGRGGYATPGRASIQRNVTELKLGGSFVAFAVIGGLFLLSSLPHLGVVLQSVSRLQDWQGSLLPQQVTGQFLGQVLTHEITGPSIVNSLKYASFATLFDVVLGVAIGYIVVRSSIRWRGWLDNLSMLPLAVPGLVMAFGYVSITRVGSPLAFLNPDRGDPTMILVVAYAVRRLPYVVRSTVAGLQQTSEVLEEAAANLGASRLTTIRRVTVPLITANLIAGCILAFSFAVLEVSDSLILTSQNKHFPITKAIIEVLKRPGDGNEMACALGVVGMALLTVTLFGASRLLGKRLGALFRV